MRLLILLCFSLLANAAAITSAQTGAWDNTSTWVGGVVPGNGDTVVLANGHTVTINSGTTVTVGSSPADNTGTAAVACSSGTGTGVLVVSGTLIFRGPVSQCASTWTISPGAIITHDSSQAAAPTTTNYKWRFNGAAAQTSAYLSAIGTQGSRITFNVAASSGNAWGFTSYNDAGSDGNVFIEYADISYWGVTGGSGLLLKNYPFTCSTSVVRGVIFRNVTIDNSGEISLQNSLGSCTFDFLNIAITNPSAARAIGIGVSNVLNTAIATNGRRRIQNVFVDGASVALATNTANLWDLGLEINGNYLRSPASASTSNAFSCSGRCVIGASGSSDLNWYESRDTASTNGSRIPGGNSSRVMAIMGDASGGHNMTIPPETSTIDGLIVWNSLDGDSGDDNLFVAGATAGGNNAVTVRNAVALRRPSGGDIGTMINITGAACTGANCAQVTLDKSTWFVGDFTGTSYLSVTVEGSNGYAGIVPSVRGNLIHRTSSGIGQIVKWSSALSVPSAAFGAVDYNWTHNVTSSPKYYTKAGAYAEYSDTPGTHDASGDPLFVDVTRTPLTYAARWDSSVTTLDILAAKYKACYQFRANGTTSCDPRFYDLADMYNWVRAGWRARNSATWIAAHDGSHVGGVAPMKTFGVLAQ